jgi:hypothetical protein
MALITQLLPIICIIPLEETLAEQKKHLKVSTIIGDRNKIKYRDFFPMGIENF